MNRFFTLKMSKVEVVLHSYFWGAAILGFVLDFFFETTAYDDPLAIAYYLFSFPVWVLSQIFFNSLEEISPWFPVVFTLIFLSFLTRAGFYFWNKKKRS